VDTDYNQIHSFKNRLSGQDIVYMSKVGLPEWDKITPSAQLLAENILLNTDSRILWLGCGHAAAAVALKMKAQNSEFWLSDISHIAIQMAALTIAANGLDKPGANIQVQPHLILSSDNREAFDIVVIDLPKGRKLAQRQLANAWESLRPGGAFYLSGSKNQGIQSVIKDAEMLFGPSVILAYKKGNRLVRMLKADVSSNETYTDTSKNPPPSWTLEPGIFPGTWHEFDASIQGRNIHLFSMPGIFSYDRLDEGSCLLLDYVSINAGQRILDLGCGHGILGLYAATLCQECQVDMVDVNLLAVEAARKNIEHHQAPNAAVFPSDVLRAVSGNLYDLILSNPPFHAGTSVEYKITHAFIHQSAQALRHGGRLLLVANRFIRYDRLMTEVFENVQVVAQTEKYHVLMGVR